MESETTKSYLNILIPYLSLFVLLFGLYLVFDLLKELNLILIPHKIEKLVSISIVPLGIVLEATKIRDRLWRIWKEMPIVAHIVVSMFFSGIILKIVPIAWQRVWNDKDEG